MLFLFYITLVQSQYDEPYVKTMVIVNTKKLCNDQEQGGTSL